MMLRVWSVGPPAERSAGRLPTQRSIMALEGRAGTPLARQATRRRARAVPRLMRLPPAASQAAREHAGTGGGSTCAAAAAATSSPRSRRMAASRSAVARRAAASSAAAALAAAAWRSAQRAWHALTRADQGCQRAEPLHR